MNNTIKIISFYNEEILCGEQRNASLAAVNKLRYICSVLSSIGYNVEVVSPSWAVEKGKYYAGKTVRISEGVVCRLFSTKCFSFKLLNCISRIITLRYFKNYLFKNTAESELILAYHMPLLFPVLSKLKEKKHIKLIYEVEEIYTNVYRNKKEKKLEYASFGLADYFIFPTELLNAKVNSLNRPYVIIHGTYQVEPQRCDKFEYHRMHNWNDDKIHVVYAGTFDPVKGGAMTAIAAAKYLPDQYHIHILGFGSECEKQNVIDRINDISKRSKCIITFDGTRAGEEYSSFLQACDIGLSTQNPDAVFNDTSFPSKILSYMANGLRVVSIRIPVVEKASIGQYIYYYDEQTPSEIAKAIMAVDLQNDQKNREIIEKLDRDFTEDIGELVRGT